MEDFDLRRYLTLGLKWSWLLILLPVAAGAYGYWTTVQPPPIYRATTTIIVGQSYQRTDVNSSDFYLSQQLATTYAEMARRQPVLQGVVERLSLTFDWQTLKGMIDVTPVEETQLLEVTVTARDPEEARVIADEVANQLIQLSPTNLQQQQQSENRKQVQERLESLQARMDSGQVQLESLYAQMTGSLSAEEVSTLQREISRLENLIADWERTHTNLLIFIESERSPNYLAVIEPAQSTTVYFGASRSRNAQRNGIVGLMLALGIIFLVEYLDDTIKSKDDMKQALGISPLGTINKIKGAEHNEKLVGITDPFSPISEAYRIIRGNIRFMSVDHPVHTLMITSATPGEGKSTTTANLAVVMAQAGLKTIIVDADLRKPMQHHIFQVQNLGGLTGLLTDDAPVVAHYLKKTPIDNLFVIPSGVIPPNPSELLGSQRMAQLVGDLQDIADIVLFDSPPCLIVADAPVLSTHVDGTILVTKAGSTRLGAAREAVLTLHQAGANLLGGILNQVSGKRGGYYYHSRYSGYSPNGNGPMATKPDPTPKVSHAERRRTLLPFLRINR
ncbi:MAG: polysaccharide biosynthesis tyrosine autokinase [Anaerolineae bacterium]|nr:polysaccharide biosynthesis tyrosine autokinase [Anaerolineae bacterium]